jgi:hypothetical protein
LSRQSRQRTRRRATGLKRLPRFWQKKKRRKDHSAGAEWVFLAESPWLGPAQEAAACNAGGAVRGNVPQHNWARSETIAVAETGRFRPRSAYRPIMRSGGVRSNFLYNFIIH